MRLIDMDPAAFASPPSKDAPRIVVKVGSRVLVQKTGRPEMRRMRALVKDLAWMKRSGCEVALVSSGAIGCGMEALGIKRRPNNLPDLQMAAAVDVGYRGMGQIDLVAAPGRCRLGPVPAMVRRAQAAAEKGKLKAEATIRFVGQVAGVVPPFGPIGRMGPVVVGKRKIAGTGDRHKSLLRRAGRAWGKEDQQQESEKKTAMVENPHQSLVPPRSRLAGEVLRASLTAGRVASRAAAKISGRAVSRDGQSTR